MKYDNQECPKCGRTCKTLYRPNWEHSGPDLCYWCNKKRVKEENKALGMSVAELLEESFG